MGLINSSHPPRQDFKVNRRSCQDFYSQLQNKISLPKNRLYHLAERVELNIFMPRKRECTTVNESKMPLLLLLYTTLFA